ncbi:MULTISPECIES: DUF3826 domain-containing protein [Prevotella]|uniref:Uncharacterized protein n=1 Tax=Prevotella herbatica TaxID=2801997 RepID=A0ABM7NZF2_9BACT|nr:MULTISPECIES: DUF3826 domain-containing protein [Prevotella]MDN5553380.1 DUF3826 domain-containing protein [Prevotella sp.]BCS85900.1 hypothetical protein prwr041_17930 [Prevotella herbatica]
MKKYLFMVMVAVMMLSGSNTVNAQVAQNGKERVHLTVDQIIQKRTEKMVQTLMLDDATSAKFIPVYSEYLKEKMECRSMKPRHMGMDINTKTDAEVDQMIQDNFAQSHKILDIREKYYAKFHKFLTPKQIMKIYQVEKNDVVKMTKEMMKRQQRGFGNKGAFARPNFKFSN